MGAGGLSLAGDTLDEKTVCKTSAIVPVSGTR